MSHSGSGHELGAILLAAGGSARLGQPKQLLRKGGETLVARSAKTLLEQDPESLIVVTGCEADAVEHELRGLPLTVVRNQNWAGGMGNSLACGVDKLPLQIEGVLIMLCDQWRITSTDLESLITTWASDISRIVAASWEGAHGPPVIFPRSMFPELSAIEGDAGAKSVLAKHRDMAEFVNINNARFDLDDEAGLKIMLQA
jgi:molybdenum cofactor cytidylyltransferase